MSKLDIKKINTEFVFRFIIEKNGIYAISIKASCKNGNFFGFFGGEDLRVELDDIKLREIPAKDKPQYYDIPPAWNGTELKRLSKTVIFILELEAGKHEIRFLPKRGAVIDKEPKIKQIENPNDIKLDLQEQAQDGNRRPWITLALINLPLRILDAGVSCEKRKGDSDDIKLIIDEKIQKHESGNWWGKNWFWQGRNLKGDTEERRFYLNLEKSNHYIEFWADRMPTLNYVWMYLGIAKDEDEQPDEKTIYKDPIKVAEGFNKIYVLKDTAFVDSSSMNEREVQKFLDSYTEKNKLHISTIDFNGQKAAYLIKKASEAYNINPKLLLSKLQVEQQLIKGDKAANPTKQQLNGAMGVGMLDDGTVIEGLQGFVNQINYAAKYFRQYFNEAEVVDFTHKNVDGKELKVVNAATYSLYRYTPHIAGPKLVYDVYKMFFSNEDLGGLLKKENNEGSISLKLLGGTALIIAVLLFFGTCFASNRAEAPIFSWKNEINLEDNNKIIADLEIFSEKKATEADAPYCGFRFGKIYESNARLFLSHDDKIIDSINLTNPELVLPDFSEEYFAYYKPWDIDGDGRKQEFVVQEYASCNGNSLSFIRLNQELDKFEKIPIVYDNNADGFNLFVDTGQDSLQVNNGNIIVTYYDVGNGKFIKDRYIFDRVKNKLVWTENSTVKGESLFYSNYYLKNISESIEMLVESANKSFYFTPEFYTVLATLFASIVALFTPFVMHWLSNKPKKSKLIVEGANVFKQGLLNVGRIIIKNDDEKYKASSAEAYLEGIEDNGKKRDEFFSIPLVWTHGQLNKNGPAIRDIYPHQPVGLDVFYHDVGNNIVSFAIATGQDVDNLSRMEKGETEIVIKVYQESGQVDKICLKAFWDDHDVLSLSII